MRKEARKNDNSVINARDYDFNGVWDTTKTTDWQKKLIGGSAGYYDAQISFSGGSENTQFLIGGGYQSQETVMPGNFRDNKLTFQSNINNTSPDKRFKISSSIIYQFDENRLPNEDLTAFACGSLPTHAVQVECLQ